MQPTRLNPKPSPVRDRFAFQRVSSEQQRSKVGFPIRKFTDQSLFAAPHDLSQRTTSFIASQRQGIHQIPLRHLIALIAKARAGVLSINRQSIETRSLTCKDQFCFKRIRGSERSGSKPTTGCSRDKMMTRRLSVRSSRTFRLHASPHPAFDRMRFLFTMSEIEDRKERLKDWNPVRRPFGLRHAKRLRAQRN